MDATTSPAEPAMSPAEAGPAEPGWLSRLLRAGDSIGLPPAYLFCVPLALLAVWGHEYPTGVDMPQHANTVRLWIELAHGPPEYHMLYRTNLFTPYLLTYAVAYPFAQLFGALAAVKIILTIAALGTPWTLARWLRVVGGDTRLAILAFPIVFGFPYLWGFLSHCFALAILFAYLTAFERQGEKPNVVAMLEATVWGLVLFFCHGVTFGVAMVSAGLRVVVRKNPLSAWRAALHMVPLAATTLFWMTRREKQVAADSGRWFLDKNRVITLFSGIFQPTTTLWPWAVVTLTALVILLILARPRLNRSPAVWVPFAVAATGFIVLPSYIASTYVMGTRFCVYVQAFGTGLVRTGGARYDRRFGAGLLALVLLSLVVLNVRLTRFNHELDGFRELATHVAPGDDVQTWMPKQGGRSEVFGFRELSEAPAWLTAAGGGLIADDYGKFYQMPVQHQKTRFPKRYQWVFTMAEDAKVHAEFPDAELVGRSGRWSLFERKPLLTGDVSVVRSAQGWGELEVDKSVKQAPLSVGGVAFEHGLGTHVHSFIRVRASKHGKLEGACGVDDGAADATKILCAIRGVGGRVLWQSHVLTRGAPAATFSVRLPENGELLFEASTARPSVEAAYVDWLDLHVAAE